MYKCAICCCVLFSAISVANSQEKMSQELLQRLKAEHQMNVELGVVDDSIPTFVKPPVPTIQGRANPQGMLNALNVIRKSKSLVDRFGLVDEQKEILDEILTEFRQAKSDLDRQLETAEREMKKYHRDNFERKCRALCNSLSEIIIPEQAAEILNSTINGGSLLNLLTTDNIVSQYVDLSDEQKRKLISESERLSEEIEEFMRKKRLEASKIFEDGLNDSQLDRLVEYVGADKLSRGFEHASSHTLITDSGRKNEPTKIGFWRSIEQRLKHND